MSDEIKFCLRRGIDCKSGRPWQSIRGLCNACYARVMRGISQGKFSEAVELAAGRMLPKKGNRGSPWRRKWDKGFHAINPSEV